MPEDVRHNANEPLLLRPPAAATSQLFRVRSASKLRAAAFQDGHRVTLISDGDFVLLGPMPPKPDIYLDQINSTTPATRASWR